MDSRGILDAFRRVMGFGRLAKSGLCVISNDVCNAFNFAHWEAVIKGLVKKNFHGHTTRLVHKVSLTSN